MTELAHRGNEARPGTTAARTPAAVAGHNRISTQALSSVAQASAGRIFGVPAAQVRADWRDESGLLALSLALPIGIPPLPRVDRNPSLVDAFGGSIWARACAAREQILAEVSRLTGSQLSRVDIRITGVQPAEGGRVQ